MVQLQMLRGFSGSSQGAAPATLARGQLLFRHGISAERPSELIDGMNRGTARAVQPGRAAHFDGTNDYVHAALSAAVIYPFTVACWALWDVAGNQCLWSINDGTTANKLCSLAPQATGAAIMDRRSGATVDTAVVVQAGTLVTGVWQHHTIVCPDSTSVLYYLDGVLEFEDDARTQVTLDAGFDDFAIGTYRNNTPALFWNGKIFDVRLYKRILSTSEIAAIHASSAPGGRPELYLFGHALLGHWKLDEGASSSVFDSSTNGDHGTASGTDSTFHYEGDDVPFSWQNEYGFAESGGDLVPASSLRHGHDINGNRLQYEGPVPRNGRLKDSFCGNFDGVDDKVTIPAALDYPYGNQQRTITGRIYWDTAISATDVFLTTGDATVAGGMIQLGNNAADTGISLSFNGIRRQAAGVLPFQTWFHFAIRVGSATVCEDVELFIDGVEVTLTTATGSSTALATVANFPTVLGDTAAMRFSDLRIYGSALTDDEIKLLAAGVDHLASWWPLGRWPIAEGDGTTIHDVSGAANHGTLTGATLATFWSQTEQTVHYNIRNGFRQVGGTGPRVPAVFGSDVTAANGLMLTHPAGNWHNAAETRVDFTGGQPNAPWCDPARIGYTLPQSYEFGDTLPDPGMTKRAVAGVETDFFAFGKPVIVIPPDPPPPPQDTTPDQITFTDLTDVDVDSQYDSELETLVGFDTPAQITVTGGMFSLNGGAFSNVPTFASPNDTIRLRVQSSASYSTAATVEVTVGGMVADFAVTTMADPGGGATTPLNSPDWLQDTEDFAYAKVGVAYYSESHPTTPYRTVFNTGTVLEVTDNAGLYSAVSQAKASATIKAIHLVPGPTYSWTTDLLDGINRPADDPLCIGTKPGEASQAKLSLVLEQGSIRGVAFVDLDITEGLRILGQNGSSDILIERCTGWLDLQGERQFGQTIPGTTLVLPGEPLTNVCVRLNNLSDHWAPVSGTGFHGLYGYNIDGLLIEGNIFDHNGWDETAGRNAADSAGGATIHKHNIYINPCWPAKNSSAVVIRYNVISRACAHGIQGKAGAWVYRNLFLNNPIGCQLGFGGDQQFTGYGIRQDPIFRNNLGIGAADVDSGNPRGVWFWTTCVDNCLFLSNLCVDNGTSSTNNETYWLERDFPIEIIMQGNESVNWPSQAPLRGAPNYTPSITDLGGNAFAGLSLTSGAQTLADTLKATTWIDALKVSRARLGVDINQLQTDMATIFGGTV